VASNVRAIRAQVAYQTGNIIGIARQAIAAIGRLRFTKSALRQGDDVKSIGKTGREVIKDVRGRIPSVQEYEQWSRSAPVEVLQAHSVNAEVADCVGRWVCRGRGSRILCSNGGPKTDKGDRDQTLHSKHPERRQSVSAV
jgi:hypothetical protein